MPKRLTKLAGLALSAVIAAGAIAGCSGNQGGSDPTHNVNPAQPTDISSIGASADASQVGEQVRAAMAELQAYRMEIVAASELDGKAMESTTSVLVDRHDPQLLKVKSTSTTQGQTIVMIQIGDDVYTRLPGVETYAHTTVDGSSIPEAGGAEQLFTQAQQVRFIGDEQLDGKAVQHYLLLDTGATIDVFVDAQHRVLKSVTTTEPTGGAGDPTSPIGKSTVEITWHDFDQNLDITAPEADQITAG